MVFTLETSANILPKRCILPQLLYCKIPTQLLHIDVTKSSLFLDKHKILLRHACPPHNVSKLRPFSYFAGKPMDFDAIWMVFVSHSDFVKHIVSPMRNRCGMGRVLPRHLRDSLLEEASGKVSGKALICITVVVICFWWVVGGGFP